MKILNKTSDGLKRCYDISISKKELEELMTIELMETVKKTRLDGFRPGKVPLDVVKRMYGESLRSKVNKSAVTDAVKKILNDEKLAISFNYETEVSKEDADGIEFTLKFELVPSFELKDVSDMEIEKYVVEVKDKEVDEVLESIRKDTKKWVEDTKIKKVEEGHKVIIDSSRLQPVGDRKKNNEVKDLEVVVGEKTFVDDFWKHLVGMKISETKEFPINYPKEFGDRTLAGKSVKHKAIVRKIFNATEHQLDDEFAKSIGFENLDKAKEWAKSRVTLQHANISYSVLKRNFLEKLSSMYDFDVPQNMIDVENKDVSSQIAEEGKRLGQEITPKIQEECLKISIDRVRLGFVIAETAKKEKIVVTKNEIAQAIKNISLMSGMHEKDVWNIYNNGGAMRTIIGPILEEKVVDFLLKKMKIKEKKCSLEELIAIDEEPFDFFTDGDASKTKNAKKSTKKPEVEAEEAPKKKSIASTKKKTK